MKPLSLLLSLALVMLLVADAWAKRIPPKPVEPVVYQGVKYVAPNASGRQGKIEARNEKTGKKLWDAVIYKVKIDKDLEEDVQWVFITAIERRDNTLLVTNEKSEKYVLDLKTHKAKRVEKTKKE